MLTSVYFVMFVISVISLISVITTTSVKSYGTGSVYILKKVRQIPVRNSSPSSVTDQTGSLTTGTEVHREN